MLARVRSHKLRILSYFARRQAEKLVERDVIRHLKRHVISEAFGLLADPPTEPSLGR
ncbi:hypothetical protein ACYSMR_18285 (plasmid) [Kocuria sp. U4B]